MRKQYILLVVISLLAFLFTLNINQHASAQNREFVTIIRTMPIEEIMQSKETCEQCHARVTPGVYKDHLSSAHAGKKVGCADCHGRDHNAFRLATAKRACQKCHPQEVAQYMKSKHAQSWVKSWDNARYRAQSRDMQDAGCNACHNISYGWTDGRCDYCHTKHKFSAAEARKPEACATCHMGPDHPQIEAYEASPHGKLYAQEGKGYEDGGRAPTCITCHQAEGTHDVSANIGIGGVSLGSVMAGDKELTNAKGEPLLKQEVIGYKEFKVNRDKMANICTKCHSRELAVSELAKGDKVKRDGEKSVLEAKKIIEGLNKAGLIYPKPEERRPNPVLGNKLVLTGQQLYEDTSMVEQSFFKMFKFDLVQSWKRSYHQDGAGSTKYSNMLQADLKEIKEEALLLREMEKQENQGLNQIETKNRIELARTKLWQQLKLIFTGAMFIIGVFTAWFVSKKGKFMGSKGAKVSNVSRLLLTLFLLTTGLLIQPGNTWAAEGQKHPGLSQDGKKNCIQCHAKQAGELKKSGHKTLACTSCHGATDFSIENAREPKTCGLCHGIGEGSIYEMYQRSVHGSLYGAGATERAPACADCHLNNGSHDVSSGIGGSAQGSSFAKKREQMLNTCKQCHALNTPYQYLSSADQIRKEADNLLNKGVTLVDQLTAQGYRFDKEGQLVSGAKGIILPEDEDLFRKQADRLNKVLHDMKTVHYQAMVKGVYHLNPDYTHWFGNAELKMDITQLEELVRQLKILSMRGKASQEESFLAQADVPAIAVAGTLALVTGLLLGFVLIHYKRIKNSLDL